MAFDSLFSAMWRFGAAATDIEPQQGTWNWNELDLTVTQLTVSTHDKDLVDQSADLVGVLAGDRIHIRNTSNAGNWALFNVIAVTDNTTWFLFDVLVPPGVGPIAGLPVFRQLVLFDFLRPVLDTAGPISGRYDDIVMRVSSNLHLPTGDTIVTRAVDAAIEYAIIRTNRAEVGLPDTELTVNGVVGFATRLYLDAFSPNGAQVSVADPSFEPIFQPEDLWKHWRHYFTVRQLAWGVA